MVDFFPSSNNKQINRAWSRRHGFVAPPTLQVIDCLMVETIYVDIFNSKIDKKNHEKSKTEKNRWHWKINLFELLLLHNLSFEQLYGQIRTKKIRVVCDLLTSVITVSLLYTGIVFFCGHPSMCTNHARRCFTPWTVNTSLIDVAVFGQRENPEARV